MSLTEAERPPDAPAAETPAGGTRRTVGDVSLRPAPLTIPEMLRRTVEHHRHVAAFLHKEGEEWHPTTYGEVEERVRALALGLIDLGLEPGERVALLAENRPEWALTDLAVASIGSVTVPLYSTLPPAQVEYILSDAAARIVVVSTAKQLAKVQEVRSRLPELRHVVVMDPPEELPEGVESLQSVMERAAKRPGGEEFQRRVEAVKPDDLATIIYTSGTTGAPKGAMLTHDNFMSNAVGVTRLVEIHSSDVFLSFLPLSHVFERMAGHFLPLLAGATVAYAESVFTVQANMVEIRPTVMASVPRLYEAFHSRILDAMGKLPPGKRRLAEWAVGVGREFHFQRISGERPDLFSRVQYAIADRLVLNPMRTRVTGGRLRFFISGGAPLPVATAEFLTSIGLHILEGYGLTETSPVICVNRPDRTRIGTVGPPIDGVEVRIAPDGEILSRGPHITQGYFNKPEDTSAAIEADGWFHTGDIGVIDPDGYLRITDRKKDILVLANGKNVAPQPIEAQLKASPFIAQVVLFGDRQPQVVALVVPDLEHLRSWAREQGIQEREPEALIALPQVKKLYREEIARLSGGLADFEMVRRFTLLPRDFSQERDELTPTLKIKRRVVAEHYGDAIQQMYGGRDEG